MHELGIIVHIAKTLDQVAAENELKKIGSVTLDIGEVSGIVPEYLTECWEFYRKKNPLTSPMSNVTDPIFFNSFSAAT